MPSLNTNKCHKSELPKKHELSLTLSIIYTQIQGKLMSSALFILLIYYIVHIIDLNHGRQKILVCSPNNQCTVYMNLVVIPAANYQAPNHSVLHTQCWMLAMHDPA